MNPPQRKRGVPMTPLRHKKKRAESPDSGSTGGLKPLLLRVKPEDLLLIAKAAALGQQTPSAFMEHHALEAARRILKEKERKI